MTLILHAVLTIHAAILDQSGSGVVPVNDEKVLNIRRIEGEIILQRGEKGTVELESTSTAKTGGAVPLVLSTDGEAFAIEPLGGAATVKSRLRVVIPPAMKIRLDVQNVTVHASQLDSDLSVRGSRIRLDASGLLRLVELDVDGGNVTVQSTAQGVTLKGKDVDARMDGITGAASVRLSGGSARLTGLKSGLQGDFVRTRLVIDTIVGSVELRLQEGRAQISALRDGGRITAMACPLVMNRLEGGLTVTSDSEVQVSDSKATLRIENSAGGVSGTRLDGEIDVTTQKSAVALSQVTGRLRVAGDELDVKLMNIAAAITVNTHASNISIEAAAAVNVENVRGNVTVKGSDALVEVKSQNGEVHLLAMNGPVNVDAAGDLVEVEFASITTEQDSRIMNDGGEARVTFLSGDSRVDAVSRFGRIHSSLPGVPVKGESAAQGVVGGGGNRVVVIKASGDVHLLGLDAAPPAGQTP